MASIATELRKDKFFLNEDSYKTVDLALKNSKDS